MKTSKILIGLLALFGLLVFVSASRVQDRGQNNNGDGKRQPNLRNKVMMLIKQLVVRKRDPPPSVCSDKNPFMKHLYQRGVDLYSQPRLQLDGCPGEWSVQGTCCDKTKLLEYAQRDQEDIMAASKLLIDQTLLFVDAVKPLYSLISEVSNDQNDNRRSNRLVSKMMHGLDRTNLNYFTSLMNQMNSPQEVSNFTAETKQCWATVADLRKRALCETCSGRSQVFFEDNLAKISQATCSKLIQACMSSFSFTIRFLKVLGILSENIKNSRLVSDRRVTTISRLTRFGTISNEIASGHLTCRVTSFRSPTFFTAGPAQYQPATNQVPKAKTDLELEYLMEASNLCNRFLRLSKEPFILEISGLFDIDMDIFEQAYETIRDISWSASQSMPTRVPSSWNPRGYGFAGSINWRFKQRLLRFETSTKTTSTTSNHLFTGDTTTCLTTCLSMDLSLYP